VVLKHKWIFLLLAAVLVLSLVMVGCAEKKEPWGGGEPDNRVFILEDPLEFWGFNATVKKAGNVDWIAENPKAAELIRQVKMTANDIGWMMAEIEEQGDDPAILEALAREWMAEHQKEVDSWLEAAAGVAGEPTEKHVIFTSGAWSGDWLTIYVPKILLEEEMGYTTEIADLSIPAAFVAVAAGEADLWTDSWLPNQQHLWDKYADKIDFLGVIYGGEPTPENICLQAWFIPKWVSEHYGITSITDLDNPEFAKMFDIDGDGIGDLLGCDAAWTCGVANDEMIVAYGLDTLYEQQYGAETMMTAAIEGRLKKGEPVLFYYYTPHPFFIKYPITE